MTWPAPQLRSASSADDALFGSTAASSAPEASRPSGSRPRARQKARVSGRNGSRAGASRWTPTLEAAASSASAVASPPSVGSCMACGRTTSHSPRAMATTEMPGSRNRSAARAIIAGGTPRARSASAASRASSAVPSTANAPPNSSASPGRAPPVVTSSSAATSPSMVPATMGRSMPLVTSVCPPTRSISSSRHAAARSSMMAWTPAHVVPGGSSNVARNQRGVAPRTAMSLALTATA